MVDRLHYIDELLTNWENSEYKGIRKLVVDKYVNHPYEDIIKYRTSVDTKQSKLITSNIKTINMYQANSIGLREFLGDYNFKESRDLNLKNPTYFRIEGSSTQQHLDEHNKFINDNTEYIMEIGFNAGISAINFLKHSKAHVVSFDIGLHSYVWYAKMFIDKKYPGRHTLIVGDSLVSVPQYNLPDNKKFDIIFVDGYHSIHYAKEDMLNSKHLANSDTILILDNVAPHNNSGVGPYIAMNMLMEEGDIEFIKHIEIEPNYDDGFSVLKYKFYNKIPQSLTLEQYKHMERKVPIYVLSEYIDDYNFKRLSKSKMADAQTKQIRKIIKDYFKKFHDIGLERDKWLNKQYTNLSS